MCLFLEVILTYSSVPEPRINKQWGCQVEETVFIRIPALSVPLQVNGLCLGPRAGLVCDGFGLSQTGHRSDAMQSDQIRSVAQSCPTLCDPMNHSTPGLPVHHQLLEFTQTHIHRVGDAIQPSHPLSSPSPPAPNPSQHQRLFQ